MDDMEKELKELSDFAGFDVDDDNARPTGTPDWFPRYYNTRSRGDNKTNTVNKGLLTEDGRISD